MKTADAASQIIALLKEGAARGTRPPSAELLAFLTELAVSPGLKKPRKKAETKNKKSSSGAAPRVGSRRKRPTEAEVSKTIEELAQKLRNAFENQASFESVLSAPETQALSKANVVTLYNRVFNPEEPLSTSLTKPEIFGAMKRERINRVRGRS
jgi:hypothetical protein